MTPIVRVCSVASMLVLAACGSSMPSLDFIPSLSGGASVSLTIESDPPGADAKISLGPTCRTPCILPVPADTSTPSGRAMFQMLGVFAEFERGMIRERVNAGLARARANGVKLGRPTVAPKIEQRVRELRAQGMGLIKIGREVGVDTGTVQRIVGCA